MNQQKHHAVCARCGDRLTDEPQGADFCLPCNIDEQQMLSTTPLMIKFKQRTYQDLLEHFKAATVYQKQAYEDQIRELLDEIVDYQETLGKIPFGSMLPLLDPAQHNYSPKSQKVFESVQDLIEDFRVQGCMDGEGTYTDEFGKFIQTANYRIPYDGEVQPTGAVMNSKPATEQANQIDIPKNLSAQSRLLSSLMKIRKCPKCGRVPMFCECKAFSRYHAVTLIEAIARLITKEDLIRAMHNGRLGDGKTYYDDACMLWFLREGEDRPIHLNPYANTPDEHLAVNFTMARDLFQEVMAEESAMVN
ncbi:hypothetical protein FCL47_14585 [Desulfopila sp. IMCC35006]|uniref:hypothetical protein n=1 Tax=Desulfopila sp. IMCC35006 TaxID=2569542 RepID=UPI0010AC449B|nr:hypothetical protein [Desulfopila sp. IMCC35006]TKB25281.1 hypothetical protein FCL47_14585 [Desulfopila sp. IMCC35006]